MIEWLPETKTLKDVIYSARTEDEIKQWDMGEKNPDYVYYHFMDDAVKVKDRWPNWNIKDTYGMAYVKYSRECVSQRFKEIENLVPWDLLRRFIRSMSSNTEAYFFLRNQFIMSYAVNLKYIYISKIKSLRSKCIIFIYRWQVLVNTYWASAIGT